MFKFDIQKFAPDEGGSATFSKVKNVPYTGWFPYGELGSSSIENPNGVFLYVSKQDENINCYVDGSGEYYIADYGVSDWSDLDTPGVPGGIESV